MVCVAICTFALALGPSQVAGDDEGLPEGGTYTIGPDRYAAGARVRIGPDERVEDAFLMGETVRLEGPVDGSVHAAGRRLFISAPIAERIYAIGFTVDVSGEIAGDATLAGYEVDLDAPVGGDLRAAGSSVHVGGAVTGYALLSGEFLQLDAAIGGDAVVAGREIAFGPMARIDGRLTLYVPDPEAVSVPESVLPPDRVSLHRIEAFEMGNYDHWGSPGPSIGQIVAGAVLAVLLTGLLAAIVIALAPERVATWRKLALAHPGRALVSGFLVTSALSGSVIVLAMTLLGILLIPFVFVLTWLVLYAGHVLGAYVLGAGIWQAAGREMPARFAGKFGIATLGAALLALAWAIPVLGWLFVMGVTLIGVGTLAAFVLPRDPLLRRPD